MGTSPIVTVAQAGALAPKAALRLGASAFVWTDADEATQEAALEAATEDIYSEPGLNVQDCTSDSAVQLACVVQAIYLLDLQSDPDAQERRRMQDQGVRSVQHSRVREVYTGRRSGLCAAARQLLRPYRGAVYVK